MTDRTSSLRQAKSLWIHGAGLSGATWRGVTADLPRAVTPDLPGHGAARPITPPRVEGFADQLSPRVEDDMVLIGHSLGGMVALEMAARHGRGLRALVLIEAVPTVTDRWTGRVGPRLARPLLKLLPRPVLAKMAGAGQSEDAAREARRWLAQMPRARLLDAFDAARTYDGRRHLARVKLPTLVIVGRQNRATHRGARLMADGMDRAEFESLPGGHMLHIDNPQGLRHAIAAFLAGIPAT
ncbi:alpha/beta fold hydrolase [Dinoroseobacter sp. S124A]|uniref:alpha/beta fold hydrolase n=1 Tax=Dinoroseobacter sp. S124A TaxID=3415128 RepID=UPI003C7C1F29